MVQVVDHIPAAALHSRLSSSKNICVCSTERSISRLVGNTLVTAVLKGASPVQNLAYSAWNALQSKPLITSGTAWHVAKKPTKLLYW